jgi:hypothetical protein
MCHLNSLTEYPRQTCIFGVLSCVEALAVLKLVVLSFQIPVADDTNSAGWSLFTQSTLLST